MTDQLTISLHNVRFRAYHGLHPEEREKGNDFVVNLQVSFQPSINHTVVSLQDTVDYSVLFEIINSAMQKPVDLLETVVQTIGNNVYKKYPRIKEVSVSVENLNPPIDHFTGSAAVRFRRTF